MEGAGIDGSELIADVDTEAITPAALGGEIVEVQLADAGAVADSSSTAVATAVTPTGAPAAAKAPPEYYDDTMEIIALTKSIISGSDLSEANIADFQAKRDVWYNNYQLHHEKGVGYGYANTFNAQAKVGFQLRVCAEKGEPFDPDHTVYNKDYLLEILDRGKAALDEMKAAGQL